MKYVIYAAVAVLVCWSVWYVVRRVRQQLRGQGCCDGNCAQCGSCDSCGLKDKKCPTHRTKK